MNCDLELVEAILSQAKADSRSQIKSAEMKFSAVYLKVKKEIQKIQDEIQMINNSTNVDSSQNKKSSIISSDAGNVVNKQDDQHNLKN